MADDLVMLSIEMCGKKGDTPRFPAYLKNSYVDIIMRTTLKIQESVFVAHESRDPAQRRSLQNDAQARCVYLNHLIRISYEKKWISDKQRDRWQKLATSLRWAIRKWSTA